MFSEALLGNIRDKFHHVDRCPYQGARIFFENAGGSLTLKSVVEVNAKLSAIPDNQGRDNPASRELVRIIQQGRLDMLTFLGAGDGLVFVGESGTEWPVPHDSGGTVGRAGRRRPNLTSAGQHPRTPGNGERRQAMERARGGGIYRHSPRSAQRRSRRGRLPPAPYPEHAGGDDHPDQPGHWHVGGCQSDRLGDSGGVAGLLRHRRRHPARAPR